METTTQVTKRNKDRNRVRITSTRGITVIALLGAIAMILMLFEIPLWFAPVFYEIDLSEVPVMIGAFALGPIAGVLIEFVKIAINLLITGTDTAFVGEFANFILGCAFVVPAALVYKKKKSKKGALIGLAVGTLVLVIAGSFINAYILLPFYSRTMLPMENIIAMGHEVNSSINSVRDLILFAVVPFNLLKGILVSLVTYLLYKKVSFLIKDYHV